MTKRGVWTVGLVVFLLGAARAQEEKPGDDLVVHEWGTFTSVQSSVGETMVGMHRVDEPLPSFVHTLGGQNGRYKGLLAPPDGVTQRLETPVLYFYTDEPREVRVEVAFPQGLVSEFYPDVTAMSPGPDAEITVADGRATWEVQVEPGLVEVPPVAPDDIWAPSRHVPEAASVLAGGEAERFIFYRGLGDFEMPVRVRHASLERLVLANESDEDLEHVFLIRVHEGGAGLEDLGRLPAGAVLDEVPSPKELDFDEYLAEAQAQVAAALEATGLYPDEARAMVETWERSYFLTPGIRVLYIVPRAWTDALLPLTLTPEPDALVRTLVGRIEVMTEDEEWDLAEQLEGLDPGVGEDVQAGWSLVDELGRLAEPKLRRVEELLENEQARELCAMLIDYAHYAE